MTAEDIAHFEKALDEWGGEDKSETYGAKHGWTVADSPAYKEPEAERAYRKMVEVFKASLG